ncbi:MAG TPA: hypothetical protein VFV93_03175 [Thermomicrobiales bacterium]|nr:hypothetical protein [Thermomicrobiales bacterium]
MAESMVHDLQDVAAEWDQLPEGERAAWSIDWDNEMAGVESLSRLAAGGVLTADLYSRYRQLLAAIHQSTPILDRLRLSLPTSIHNP